MFVFTTMTDSLALVDKLLKVVEAEEMHPSPVLLRNAATVERKPTATHPPGPSRAILPPGIMTVQSLCACPRHNVPSIWSKSRDAQSVQTQVIKRRIATQADKNVELL